MNGEIWALGGAHWLGAAAEILAGKHAGCSRYI